MSSAFDFGILILDPSGGIRISSSFSALGLGMIDKSNSLGGGISLSSIVWRCGGMMAKGGGGGTVDDDALE